MLYPDFKTLCSTPTADRIGATQMDWEALDAFVRSYDSFSQLSGQLFHVLSHNIHTLLDTRWCVEPRVFSAGIRGGTIPKQKLIVYDRDLDPYQRDLTIFHGMGCILNPSRELDKTFFSLARPPTKKPRDFRNHVAEWLGRQGRADPRALALMYEGFGLRPQIYDHASACAFPHATPTQLMLPGFLRPIFMDAKMPEGTLLVH